MRDLEWVDDLSRLPYLIEFSRCSWRVMLHLTRSIVVIGGLIIGAIDGVFTTPVAVLSHEISGFVVIGSGLRMLHAAFMRVYEPARWTLVHQWTPRLRGRR